MPAILHSSSILIVKSAVPSTEYTSQFLIQNVPPLLALKMFIMFSSCCHNAGPQSLTTTEWTLDLCWPKWTLSPRNQMGRAQVIACQGAGLGDAGKDRLRQRKLVCGEQKRKAWRPRGETVGPRKGRDLGSDFSSWFLSRACFYLHP